MSNNDYNEIKNNYKVTLYEDGKGKKVKFYEMIHISPQEFYDKREKLINEDIHNGFLIFHEGVKNVPEDKGDLMNVYKMLGESIGWILQPKPTYPFFNIDADYNRMNMWEKLFLRGVNSTSKMMIKAFEELKKDEEKYKKFTEKLRGELIALEDEPEAIEESIVGKIFSPLVKWTRSFLLDSRNVILVNAILNEESNVSLIWGKAHHSGVGELLKNYGYKITSENIVE